MDRSARPAADTGARHTVPLSRRVLARVTKVFLALLIGISGALPTMLLGARPAAAALAAPTLSVSSYSTSSISVSWTTVSGAACYRLTGSTDGVNFTALLAQGVSTTSGSWTGRTANTIYYVRVRSSDSWNAGTSTCNLGANASSPTAPSANVTVTTTPGAVTGLTATQTASGCITLSWAAYATGNGTITEYQIARQGVIFVWFAGVNLSYTMCNLTIGTAYSLGVRANNGTAGVTSGSAVGTWSYASAVTVANWVPGTPTVTGITSGYKSITVTWSAPPATQDCAVTGYSVEVFEYVAGFPSMGKRATNSTSTTYTYTGLDPDVAAFPVVSAINCAGEGAQTAVNDYATPYGDPPQMSTPTVTRNGSGKVNVAWTDSTGAGVSSYQVRYSADTTFGGASTCTGAGTTCTASGVTSPTTISSLANGTSYAFQVRAYNGGWGPWSSSGTITPCAAPSTPSSGSLTLAQGYQQITPTWVDPSANGCAISDYNVRYSTSAAMTNVTSKNGWTSGTPITGLTNGTTYYFQFQAKNDVGWSGWGPSPAASNYPGAVPGAPSGLALTQTDSKQVQATFNAPGSDGGLSIDQYQVQCGVVSGGVTSWHANCHAEGTDPIILNASTMAGGFSFTPGSTYAFRVRAHNSVGWGDWSATTSPFTITRWVYAPTNIVGVANGAGQIDVTWDAASSECAVTNYAVVIEEFQLFGGGQIASTSTGTVRAATFTGLNVGSYYIITATAANCDMASDTGSSEWWVLAATNPLPMATPTVTASAAGTIEVAFTSVDFGSAGSAPIPGYTETGGYAPAPAIPYAVECSATGGVTLSGSATASPVTLTGATGGKTYTCSVQVTNAAGLWSTKVYSSAIVPYAVPDKPAFDISSANRGSSGRIDLTFADPANNGSAITNYAVEYSTDSDWLTWGTTTGSITSAGTLVNGVRTISVTGLTNGTMYYFRAKAYNSAGWGAFSDNFYPFAYPYATPGRPTGVAISQSAARCMAVSFDAPADNGGDGISSYDVQWGQSATFATYAGLANGSASPIEICNLTLGVTYYARVRAYNQAGAGAFSTQVSGAYASLAVTSWFPDAPTITSATASGDGGVLVSWAAPASDCAISDYTVSATTYNPFGTGVDAGSQTTGSGATQSLAFTGLTPGGLYLFFVGATNCKGGGPASSSSYPVQAATRPAALAKPTATAPSAQAITVTFGTITWGNEYDYTSTAGYAGPWSDEPYYVACTTPGGVTLERWVAAGPVEFTDAVGGATYTCTVAPKNSAGLMPAANTAADPVTAYDVPDAVGVGDLTATATYPGYPSAHLTWSVPNENGAAIDHFDVRYSQSSAMTDATDIVAAVSSVNGVVAHEYSFGTGVLDPGVRYFFQVRAHNAAGDAAWGPSTPVTSPADATPYTVPDPPMHVAVDPGDTTLAVTWDPPDWDGANAVDAYTATATAAGYPTRTCTTTTLQPPLSCAITDLVNGVSYAITVTATNDAGIGAPSTPPVVAIPDVAPEPITWLGLTEQDSAMELSWIEPVTRGTSVGTYEVRFWSADDPTITTIVSDIVWPTARVDGLQNGKMYCFEVRARNDAAWSNWGPDPYVCGIPHTVASAPTVSSVSVSNGTATMYWSAPADNGGADIDGYRIMAYLDESALVLPGGVANPQETGSDATNGEFTGLASGVTYYFRVMAHTKYGWGVASTTSVGAAQPPSTMEAPTVTVKTDAVGAITAAFTPVEPGATPDTGYSTLSATPYTVTCTSDEGATPGTASGATSPIVVSGLTPGALYTCTTTVSNNGGFTSDPSPASTPAVIPLDLPTAPLNASALAGATDVNVQWDAPGETGSVGAGYTTITDYRIAIYTDSAGTTLAAVADGTLVEGTSNPQIIGSGTPGFTLTGIVAGHEYFYRIAAQNSVGWGPYSDVTNGAPMTPTQMAAPSVVESFEAVEVSFDAVTGATAAAGNAPLADTPYTATCTSSDGGASGSATGTAAPILVPALTAGRLYTCTITVTNAWSLTAPASDASTSVIPYTTPTTPPQPSVAVVATESGTVDVTFTAVSDGSQAAGFAALDPAIPYFVACSASDGDPGSQSESTDNGDGTRTARVTGLTPGSAYTCTITVTNVHALSETSAPSDPSVIPVTEPDAPTNVHGEPGVASAIIAWDAPGETGTAGAGYTTIIEYRVAAFTDADGLIAATDMANPQIIASGGTFTGLANGVTYWFRVAAVNSVTDPDAGPASAVSNAVTVFAAPDPPGDVDATRTAADTFTVTFAAPPSDGGTPVTNYTVEYSSDGFATTSGEVSGASSPIAVSGLPETSEYCFRVYATNLVGPGAASAGVCVVMTPPPAAPTNVVASPRYNAMFLTWNADAGVTGYKLCIYTDASASYRSTTSQYCPGQNATGSAIVIPQADVVVMDATRRSYGYLVTGLVPGTSYTARVFATNMSIVTAASSWSAVSSASNVAYASVNAVSTGSNDAFQTAAITQTPAGGTANPMPQRTMYGTLAGKTIASVDNGATGGCARTTEPANNLHCWGVITPIANGGAARSTPVLATTGALAGKTVTNVSVGGTSACATTNETMNNLYCWGANTNGQLGNDTLTTSTTPVRVAGLTGITIAKVSVGYNHVCAIDASGSARCWGANLNGQLGVSATTDIKKPALIPASVLTGSTTRALTTIVAGTNRTCAITTDTVALLYCWGSDRRGALGLGSETAGKRTPTLVTGFTRNASVTDVALGDTSTYALTNETADNLYSWGANDAGQLGTGDSLGRTKPGRVAGPAGLSATDRTKRWISVTASGGDAAPSATGSACATTSDTPTDTVANLFCWGQNTSGQVGVGHTLAVTKPTSVRVRSGSLQNLNVADVSAGRNFACARALDLAGANGSLHCWGLNDANAFTLGMGAGGSLATNYAVGIGRGQLQAPKGASDLTIASLAASDANSCIAAANFRLACWGSNTASESFGSVGTTTPEPAATTFGLLVPRLSPTDSAVSGPTSGATGCGLASLTAAGNLRCWGSNGFSKIVNGGVSVYTNPMAPLATNPITTKNVRTFAVGARHVCATTSETPSATTSNLYCWGANASGQTGNPVAAPTYNAGTGTQGTPLTVTNGTVNGSGGLANKTVVGVAVGYAHTCAITTESVAPGSSNVWCWGANALGQLGRGSAGSGSNAAPVRVTSGAMSGVTAVAIAAGPAHTCVLSNQGAVICWGSNNSGELGTGTTSSASSVPVAVNVSSASSLQNRDVVAITAGGTSKAGASPAATTCAISRDGTAHCWGNGGPSWRGDGVTTSSSYPVAIKGFAGDVTSARSVSGAVSTGRQAATSIAIGARHTLIQTGPAAPSITAISGNGTTSATVTVTPNANPGLGGAPTRYVVQYATSPAGPWYDTALTGQSASSASTSVTVSGLTSGTTTWFRASVVSAEGTSASSLPVSAIS